MNKINKQTNKYYGCFKRILSVCGKYGNDVAVLHPVSLYCLPRLMYGGESVKYKPSQSASARTRSYALCELTSQNLWSRYVRHFVGITWHNVWS